MKFTGKFTGNQMVDHRTWSDHVRKNQTEMNVEPWEVGQRLMNKYGYVWVYQGEADNNEVWAYPTEPGDKPVVRSLPRSTFTVIL